MTSHDGATSWHNWAGTATASPAGVRTPRSAAEVADEITRAAADALDRGRPR